MFYQTKIHSIGPEIVRDGALYGNGYLKVFEENKKVKIERVFPMEITVDLAESMHGKPRQLFQTKVLTRDKLRELFPSKKAEINKAEAYKERTPATPQDYLSDDLIQVYEAWRLPSFEGSDDGVHVIAIRNAVLIFEDYERTYFPFAQYRFQPKSLGFYGQSIASQLMLNQIMLNRLIRIVDKSLLAFANPKVYIPNGSDVNSDHFTRGIGVVIRGNAPPQLLTQDPLPPQIFSWIENIYRKSFETIGISQQTAAAQKQPGLTSGAAINAVDDIQSDRLSGPSIRLRRFFRRCSSFNDRCHARYFQRRRRVYSKIASKRRTSPY